MSADQPCDFTSSPVSSKVLRLSQPITPLGGRRVMDKSVMLASSANTRWWVGKQVRMSVILPLLGSYMEKWRVDCSIGVSFAEGWSEPLRQKSGLANWPTREVNQTRPVSSIIGLCMLAWLSQITSSPQYGDGPRGLSFDVGGLRSSVEISSCR